jgi:hypothetical protein
MWAAAAAGMVCATVPAVEPPDAPPAVARGPLRVHPKNPRYFADGSGRAILLTGSHTWNNLVDMGPTDPPPPFDCDAYLRWLKAYPHNFIRLWTWELVSWDTRANRDKQPLVHFAAPHPWPRTGPGMALDGKPRFDLAKPNPVYFARLRDRVRAAQARGIYVSVMLFEGWGLQFVTNAVASHPFHPSNNINGIIGTGVEIHELRDPAITAVQEAYVRRVIETVNPFDNVLYEISNENHPASTGWQVHMIRFIREVERALPRQHPAGMTFQYKGGSNRTLMESPADWISPNPEGGYRDDPPVADGTKVILSDTDHLWGIGGTPAWVWKSFLRGMNPIYMDPYDGRVLSRGSEPEPVRKSMGQVLGWSRRIDLAAMTPRNDLASTAYCLADPGREYLVYLPGTNGVSVNLEGVRGEVAVEWFAPGSGATRTGGTLRGGGRAALTSPFETVDAVLHLTAVGEGAE